MNIQRGILTLVISLKKEWTDWKIDLYRMFLNQFLVELGMLIVISSCHSFTPVRLTMTFPAWWHSGEMMAGYSPAPPRQAFMGAAYSGTNSCRMANHLYASSDPQLIQEQLINPGVSGSFPQQGTLHGAVCCFCLFLPFWMLVFSVQLLMLIYSIMQVH